MADVVIVSGENAHLVDALSAGPLATMRKAPILLASERVLPAATAIEIKRLGATRAYVIGTVDVIGPAVETALRAAGITTIVRLGGADRYDTAAAVSREEFPPAPAGGSAIWNSTTIPWDSMMCTWGGTLPGPAGDFQLAVADSGLVSDRRQSRAMVATIEEVEDMRDVAVTVGRQHRLVASAVDSISPTDTVNPVKTSSPPTTSLRWPAPTLSNPITLTLPTVQASPYYVNLNTGQDYIIKFENKLRTSPIAMFGGRNVYFEPGWETNITNTTSTNSYDRTAFVFRYQTGTVHLEGWLCHGAGLTECIDIDAPGATFQLQNCRVDQLHAGLLPQHPDIIQTWNGPKILRIWNLSAYTDYTGFMMMRDTGIPGAVYPGVAASGGYIAWDRVNINPYNPSNSSTPTMGSVLQMLSPSQEYRIGEMWINTGYYSTTKKTLKDSSGFRDDTAYPGINADGTGLTWSWQDFNSAGTAYAAEFYHVLGVGGPSGYSSHQGDYMVFTRPNEDNIWNFDKTGSGRIYQGIRPGGDYVPASAVGANYTGSV